MSITVEELMMHLEHMPKEAEVRLAIQPSYPFQHTIDSFQGIAEAEVDDGRGGRETVVYIAESGQHRDAPYLPDEAGEAGEAVGW